MVAVTTIDTVANLDSAIALLLNTTAMEISDSIPLFRELTERDLNRQLRVPAMERVLDLVANDDGNYDIPGDLLEVINIRTRSGSDGGGTLLFTYRDTDSDISYQRVSYDQYLRAQDEYWTQAVFAEINGQYVLHPAPSGDLEIYYYGFVPFLGSEYTDTNGDMQTVESNIWLVDAFDALLYGSASHGSSYLRDKEQVTEYQTRYRSEVERMKLETKRAQWSGQASKFRLRAFRSGR